jgi:hypothetical protein
VTNLKLCVDICSPVEIAGWVDDDGPLEVIEIVVNNNWVSSLSPTAYRPDLEQAGIGGGQRAFCFPLTGRLQRGYNLVAIKRGSEILYENPDVLLLPSDDQDKLPIEIAQAADHPRDTVARLNEELLEKDSQIILLSDRVHQLESIVIAKYLFLEEKDDDQRKVIVEKDILLNEKDAMLNEKDAVLKEKDAVIVRLNTERDGIISEVTSTQISCEKMEAALNEAESLLRYVSERYTNTQSKRFLRRLRNRWRYTVSGYRSRFTPYNTIRNSSLFDQSYYLACNPDVKASGIDPVVHYLRIGSLEGRSPSPYFSEARYRNLHPDVVSHALSGVEHYETQGRSEGRRLFERIPHPKGSVVK